jgi:hypothetical protein
MPGGSVTKIGPTYKKWTYIARKQNTTHEKTAYLTKFHSTAQVQRTEYKIQNTGKQQHKQKKQNTNKRKKLLPGIELGPSSL